MQITGHDLREKQLQWALRVAEIVRAHGALDEAAGISEAIHQLKSERFLLVVLGTLKRGKSTLVNALLGQRDDRVAPIGENPVSSAIVKYRWADGEHATVAKRDGSTEEVGFNQIRDYVTERLNPRNTREVREVEVAGPFPGLDRDLLLVDTPGAESIFEHHDDLLYRFIPQADAVIFMVDLFSPLEAGELELLRRLKKEHIDNIFFAMNMVDLADSKDQIEEAVEQTQRHLAAVGVSVSTIHRISARRALEGDYAQSGLGPLADEIRRHMAAHKGDIIAGRFAARVAQLAAPSLQGMEVEIASTGKASEQLDRELAELRASRENLERERPLAEKAFALAWKKAVRGFADRLPKARVAVQAAVKQHIESTWAWGVERLRKDLGSVVLGALETELKPKVDELGTELAQCCARFESESQGIEINHDGGVLHCAIKREPFLLSSVLRGTAIAVPGCTIGAVGTAVSAAAAGASGMAGIMATAGTSWVGSAFGLGSMGVAAGGISQSLATAAAIAGWAGPAGLILVGLGVAAVPVGWLTTKHKIKGQLQLSVAEHIDEVFKSIQTDRIALLDGIAQTIIEERRLSVDRQLMEIEAAVSKARTQRPDAQRQHELQQMAATLRTLLTPGLGSGSRFGALPTTVAAPQ